MQYWKNKKLVLLIVMLLLIVSSTSCSKKSLETSSGTFEKGTADNSIWQVELLDVKVIDELNTIAKVKQYDGSIMDVPYANKASEGSEYLLLNLDVKKIASGNNSFLWEKVSVLDDAGVQYHRIDDMFLTDHAYERMNGTDLKIGENVGWICFEIPKTSENKSLTFLYEAEEGNIEIALKNN